MLTNINIKRQKSGPQKGNSKNMRIAQTTNVVRSKLNFTLGKISGVKMRAIPQRLRDVSCIGAIQVDITFRPTFTFRSICIGAKIASSPHYFG